MVRKGCTIFFFFSALVVGAKAWAFDEHSFDVYGAHYGYVSDVPEEKNRRDVEMVLLQSPPETKKPLQDVIFNEKLSKEFQSQYEYKFGRSQAEQVLNSVGSTDQYTYYTGQNVTVQEYAKYQRQFAEYMGRRLTEYHVDNWVKNDPQLRPVYELKDRVSNLDVKFKRGYKAQWRYNFAGPTMDVKVENPYDVEAKVRMEMSGIISSPVEYIYTMGYPVSNKVSVTGLYRQFDGLYQIIATRRLTKSIGTSITGSVDTREQGPTVKQDLILVGFSWSD